jgi:hypothetical protein
MQTNQILNQFWIGEPLFLIRRLSDFLFWIFLVQLQETHE